jgi:hypothetical protein
VVSLWWREALILKTVITKNLNLSVILKNITEEAKL